MFVVHFDSFDFNQKTYGTFETKDKAFEWINNEVYEITTLELQKNSKYEITFDENSKTIVGFGTWRICEIVPV